MAIRNIVKIPDPILNKRCREVEVFDEKLWTLLDDMKETLEKAQGAGLAAPQVAVLKRVFIVQTDDGFFEIVNPVLVSAKGAETDNEGCLSVPGKYGLVERPTKVVFKGQDRFGKPIEFKVKDFTARAFCHENDHLDGIIYTSKCQNLQTEKE